MIESIYYDTCPSIRSIMTRIHLKPLWRGACLSIPVHTLGEERPIVKQQLLARLTTEKRFFRVKSPFCLVVPSLSWQTIVVHWHQIDQHGDAQKAEGE